MQITIEHAEKKEERIPFDVYYNKTRECIWAQYVIKIYSLYFISFIFRLLSFISFRFVSCKIIIRVSLLVLLYISRCQCVYVFIPTIHIKMWHFLVIEILLLFSWFSFILETFADYKLEILFFTLSFFFFFENLFG